MGSYLESADHYGKCLALLRKCAEEKENIVPQPAKACTELLQLHTRHGGLQGSSQADIDALKRRVSELEKVVKTEKICHSITRTAFEKRLRQVEESNKVSLQACFACNDRLTNRAL